MDGSPFGSLAADRFFHLPNRYDPRKVKKKKLEQLAVKACKLLNCSDNCRVQTCMMLSGSARKKKRKKNKMTMQT